MLECKNIKTHLQVPTHYKKKKKKIGPAVTAGLRNRIK